MSIILNMIVKNEAERIERCLASLLPAIDAWCIRDTGSTDSTPEVVERFFERHGVPGRVTRGEFRDFSQARNEALEDARGGAAGVRCDWVLLCDADMELVGWPKGLAPPEDADACILSQRCGSQVYGNVRLVRSNVEAAYHGVTHEILQVKGSILALEGPFFADHADGSNRGEKSERDKRLLERGVKEEPTNERYAFYLAQTYLDLGMTSNALKWYVQRTKMGGYGEEVWYSLLKAAECRQRLKDPRFVEACWTAYDADPTRPEPLSLLGWHLFHDGKPDAACVAADLGLNVEVPGPNRLFVNEYPSRAGFLDLLSRAGTASKLELRRTRARQALASLTINPWLADRDGALARWVDHAPVLDCPMTRIDVPPHLLLKGWRSSTPSVSNAPDGGLVAVVRTINYEYDWDTQSYPVPPSDGGTIRTVNLLCRLDPETLAPGHWRRMSRVGPAQFVRNAPIQGLEDCRLFWWRGRPWVTATCCDVRPDGKPQVVLCPLTGDGDFGPIRVNETLGGDQPQKNWMPVAGAPDDAMPVVYMVGLLTEQGPKTIIADWSEPQPKLVAAPPNPGGVILDRLRGGSQLLPLPGGDGWLACTHEVAWRDGRRYYMHRLVRFGKNFAVIGFSKPFFFRERTVEFCAGAAWWRGRLLLSFSVRDKESWVAALDLETVRKLFED